MFSSLSQNKNNHASQSTIYKNDAESRIWYLGNPPGIDSPGNPFRQVRVEQFSAPGKMKYELFADEATWDPPPGHGPSGRPSKEIIPRRNPASSMMFPFLPDRNTKR